MLFGGLSKWWNSLFCKVKLQNLAILSYLKTPIQCLTALLVCRQVLQGILPEDGRVAAHHQAEAVAAVWRAHWEVRVGPGPGQRWNVSINLSWPLPPQPSPTGWCRCWPSTLRNEPLPWTASTTPSWLTCSRAAVRDNTALTLHLCMGATLEYPHNLPYLARSSSVLSTEQPFRYVILSLEMLRPARAARKYPPFQEHFSPATFCLVNSQYLTTPAILPSDIVLISVKWIHPIFGTQTQL